MSDRRTTQQTFLSLRSVDRFGLPGVVRPAGNTLGVGMVGNSGPSQPLLPPRRGKNWWTTQCYTVVCKAGETDINGHTRQYDMVKCLSCGAKFSLANETNTKKHFLDTKKCSFIHGEKARELAPRVQEIKDALMAFQGSATASAAASSGAAASSSAGPSSSTRPGKRARGVAASFDIISAKEQLELEHLMTKMLACSGTPFHWVENPFVRAFLTRLRPAFKLPSR